MSSLFHYLADHPVVLVFLLCGLGMALGRIKLRAIGLGAAGVLFCAIVFSAVAPRYGVQLALPSDIGHFGLALFAFNIGITAGPSFFHSVKNFLVPLLATVVLFGAVAAVAYGIGVHLFHLDIAVVAGTYAGALTNTPSLAAASSASGEPALTTVGYSVSYLYGVVGMMIAVLFALRYSRTDRDAPSPLDNQTVVVDRTDKPTIQDILTLVDNKVAFSRVKSGDQPVQHAAPERVLLKGDLITVVGPRKDINHAATLLGRDSTRSLIQDRSQLDFRRITISDPKIAGRTIASLNLTDDYHATISRVRRGDVDMIAQADLVLQEGDRVRVVAPTKKMPQITKFFGDSAGGLSDINPVILGLGMVVGLLLGGIPIPTGGGSTFHIGAAAGTLIVGLILGKIGRIGSVITTLPYTATIVLSEFGLLIFLAQAGTVAGGQIIHAFSSGEWLSILALGFILTSLLAASVYVVMRWMFGMGGTKLAGYIAGVQTQPAVLAFANARTGFDPRVALGYSLIYPVAMIAKILTTQVLAGL